MLLKWLSEQIRRWSSCICFLIVRRHTVKTPLASHEHEYVRQKKLHCTFTDTRNVQTSYLDSSFLILRFHLCFLYQGNHTALLLGYAPSVFGTALGTESNEFHAILVFFKKHNWFWIRTVSRFPTLATILHYTAILSWNTGHLWKDQMIYSGKCWWTNIYRCSSAKMLVNHHVFFFITMVDQGRLAGLAS